MRMTPQRRAKRLPEKVKEMRIQVQKQLISAVRAAHPINPAQTRLTNLPPLNLRNRHPLDRWMPPPRMRHHHRHSSLIARCNHLVNLGDRSRHWFFEVHVRPALHAIEHQRQVIADLPRRHHRDIRLLLL